MAILNETGGGTAAVAEETAEEKSSSGLFGNFRNYVSAVNDATSEFISASTQPIRDWFNEKRSARQEKKLEKQQAKSEDKISDYDEQIAKLEAERDKEQQNLDVINDSLDMYGNGATVSEVKAMTDDAKDKTYVVGMEETAEDGTTSSHNEAYTSAQIEQMRVEIAQYDAEQYGTDAQANLDAMHAYEADVKDAAAEEQSGTGLFGNRKTESVDGKTLDTDKLHGISAADGTAGMAASMGTGAAAGAAIGSFIPGAGTAVGAAAGTAIGGVSAMISGTVGIAASQASDIVETDAAGYVTGIGEGEGYINQGLQDAVHIKNSLNVSADGIYHDEEGNETSVSRSAEEIDKMRQIVASADALDAGGNAGVAKGVLSGLQTGTYNYDLLNSASLEDDAMYANAGLDDELTGISSGTDDVSDDKVSRKEQKKQRHEQKQEQKQAKREARVAAAGDKFGDLAEADAGDEYEDDDSVSIV